MFKFAYLVQQIIIGIVFLSTGFAQPLCVQKIADTQIAFKSGEKLVYAASYKWGLIFTDVGEVSLEILSSGHPHSYFVKGIGRTYRFYDNFFKVYDVYQSRFTTPSFQSTYFYRHVKEGDYEMRNTYNFDWSKNVINGVIQRQKSEPRNIELQLTTCTIDVLNFFYYLRSLDFSQAVLNQTFASSIALDDNIYSIKCRYLGKEVKKIKGLDRKVNCLKFAVEVIAGSVFKGNESVTMWVSDDKNHIPLELESPIIVGKIKGRILSYEQLKFPLNYAD